MSRKQLEPCIPLDMKPEKLNDLAEKAKEFALLHGIGLRQKDNLDNDAMTFAPFLLFPTPFPANEFKKAIELQPVLNELMHKVAHDDGFLRKALEQTIKVDDFTRKLFEIYDEVISTGGPAQEIDAGLFRSDYFYCLLNERVKQVEFNTIASSFGSVTTQLVNQHKYVVQEAGYSHLLDKIPENNALFGLASALVKCWKIYARPKSVIMFLVEDVTYNICDQKFHEFEIRRQCPDAFVVRKTLTDIGERGKLTKDKRLEIDGEEVAVIYMRSGYHPEQYHSNLEWKARRMMEFSLAIKSPSIHYHLAGTKKVQQELARDGVLEKFLGDKVKIDSVKDIFTGLYSLDKDDKGDATLKKAIESPEKYVLKPQREGGGNNVYGADIKPYLENIKDSDERCAYILMDRIQPPITKNLMVRPKMEPFIADCVSELGIFGYIIGSKNEIFENEQVGHMLRTKLSHMDEGGVASGSGALDSVFLVDVERCCT